MVTIEAQRQKIGKQLYVAAWIVEVLAASLGLALAVIMLLAAKKQLSQLNNDALASGDTFTIYLAGLPFLAVAVVELLKIPFAAACYFSTTKLTKIIFGFCLFLISILTFETFLFGLEQNSSVRLRGINQVIDKIAKQKKSLEKLKEDENKINSKLKKKEFEKLHKERINDLRKEKETFISDIEKDIADYKKPLERVKNNLKKQINAAKKAKKKKEKQIQKINKKIEIIRNRSFINVELENSYKKQFKEDNKNVTMIKTTKERELKNKIDIAIQQQNELKDSKIKNCGWWDPSKDCPRIIKDLEAKTKKESELKKELLNYSIENQLKENKKIRDQKIRENREDNKKRKKEDEEEELITKNKINIVLSGINKKLKALENKLDNFNDTDESKDVQNKINKKFVEKEEKRKEYAEKFGALELKRKNFDTSLKTREGDLKEISAKKDSLENQIIDSEKKLDEQKRGNQFYRFAMLLPGIESPSDVKNQHISLVAQVWFISLAGIIAWMGTLLAFASFVVRYGPSSSEAKIAKAAAKAEKATAKAEKATAKAAVKAANAKSSKLRRCLRLLFIEARKYIRQPKIKEIEKVVEKIVEVEKEIVVEKIVPTEVIKEVPVDRVVIQNVPTEVIRKEVIHVPIASDDLTILDVKKIKPATTKGQREDSSKENPEKDEK